MKNDAKRLLLMQLRDHLSQYRSARRRLALAGARLQEGATAAKEEVGFHALGIAEAIDRLDGSTR